MKKFIIRQTVNVEVRWMLDAETEKEALEKAYGNFDDSQIVSIDALEWDTPYAADEVRDEDIHYWIDKDSKILWRSVGVI